MDSLVVHIGSHVHILQEGITEKPCISVFNCTGRNRRDTAASKFSSDGLEYEVANVDSKSLCQVFKGETKRSGTKGERDVLERHIPKRHGNDLFDGAWNRKHAVADAVEEAQHVHRGWRVMTTDLADPLISSWKAMALVFCELNVQNV